MKESLDLGLSYPRVVVNNRLQTVYRDRGLCCWLKLNSVALVRERTIPTERPPPVGEVSACCWHSSINCLSLLWQSVIELAVTGRRTAIFACTLIVTVNIS